MSTLTNIISNSASSIDQNYPIIAPSSDNKGKEEALEETIEQTTLISDLHDDAAYAILNHMDSKSLCRLRIINSIWLKAIDTVILGRHWNLLQKMTQNPSLRSTIQQINSNVSLAQQKIFIRLFVESVICSVLNPSSGEVDSSEEGSLSMITQSFGPNFFSRFSDLTDELRKRGAPIPKEHVVLGFDRYPYEKMQQEIDSVLETIWTRIQEMQQLEQNLDFEGAPVPENAQAIRAWLNDPTNAEKIANITQLNLYGLNLTFLPSEIGKFTGLTTLRLSGNQLRKLPEEIGNLTRLTLLSLDGNRLDNVPETFSNLSQLTELYFTSNLLRKLPEPICNLPQLTELNLYDNQLDQLPIAIGNLTQLAILNLSENRLVWLPKTFGSLTQLRELNLRNNELDSMPEAIANLPQLTILHLSGNPFTD